MDVERFISFSKLLTAFGRIERTTPFPHTERYENDMEHSFHLAMTAWHLISGNNLDLDINLVLKYTLSHDLVEVHAGDTCVWSTDLEYVESKHERERIAAEQLKADFPEFNELHQCIAEYEQRESREAQFVYALDKVLPILMNYENEGRMWREKGVTLEMLIEKKESKVAISPEVQPYYDALIELLREKDIMAKK